VSERLDFLLSEAADGPWWPEKKGDLWLANDAGDSLHVDFADVAALLNAAVAERAAGDAPLNVERLAKALRNTCALVSGSSLVVETWGDPADIAAEYARLASGAADTEGAAE